MSGFRQSSPLTVAAEQTDEADRAAILVSRGMKVLQAAPAAYPYRSAHGSSSASMKIAIIARYDFPLRLPSAAFLFAPTNFHQRVEWLRVASFSSLPEDGTPQFTPIRAARWLDANVRVTRPRFLASVTETGDVVALKTHHARAAVAYDAEKRLFRCVCWGVEFDLNGKPLEDKYAGLAPGIHQVEVKVQSGEVFVRRPNCE